MNYKTQLLSLLLIFVVSILGCAGQQTRTKSSVVDYLYPSGSDVAIKPSVPTLELPLKVGIAFVPETEAANRSRNLWTGVAMDNSALTTVNKAQLLEKVAGNFRELEFVSDIEVIPSEYLTPNGGFSNLEQIQTMYGIDVIALVSYDQVQFTDEGFLSLTYWTIVGAYVVSGEKNDTSTMLDTVVYDIKSKKMLFRAPGTSVVNGSATLINLSEQLRTDSVEGFNLAAEKMIENLKVELNNFKEKIKREPEQVKIVHSKDYSGGFGVISLYELAVLLLIAVAKRNQTISSSRRKRHAA
ncbi:MAG: rhombotarget lipoprotein [Bacteroidota bacterium]